ncbi:MAG: hypothetical protein HDS53_06135 [Barnesiella sp.]|nr:hypothetical protein [Barnesiella sp.]
MKKSLLISAAALTVAASAMAQHEHVHVFRNDKNFNSFKGSDIESIQYLGEEPGFDKMMVTDVNGKETVISASVIDSVRVCTTGLPVIHVTLQDYPGWTELTGSKSTVHQATLYIDGNGMMDDLAEQTVEFRGRGNSTWNMPKKPYRFKMAKKQSLGGMKKAKTFALIANYIDNTLMRNAVALWTANWLEMPYSNHCVPVRVELNGIDKGAYMMTEKIGIGGGSVDLDEYTGILFEIDSNYDEDYRFAFSVNNYSTRVGGQGCPGRGYLPVMVKDPDFTEICDSLGTTPDDYLNVWKEDFAKMATAVCKQSSELPDLLDLESVADFFIVNCLAGNHEMNHPKSFYIHKADREEGTKYKFGPVWDFDWAFTFNGNEGASATAPLVTADGDCSGYTFLKQIFSNPTFRTIYKERWDRFVSEGYPELLKYMEEYANTIEPSAKLNGQLWPGGYYQSWCITDNTFEFRKNFETLKKWLAERVEYCNSDANYGLYR